MGKDIRDVKDEYGYILRWTVAGGDEAGNTWDAMYFLEDIYTGDVRPITDDESIKFIRETTLPRFKNNYDNYIKLFEIIGVKPMDEKERMIRYIRIVTSLSVRGMMNENDRRNFKTGAIGKEKLKKYIKDIKKMFARADQLL